METRETQNDAVHHGGRDGVLPRERALRKPCSNHKVSVCEGWCVKTDRTTWPTRAPQKVVQRRGVGRVTGVHPTTPRSLDVQNKSSTLHPTPRKSTARTPVMLRRSLRSPWPAQSAIASPPPRTRHLPPPGTHTSWSVQQRTPEPMQSALQGLAVFHPNSTIYPASLVFFIVRVARSIVVFARGCSSSRPGFDSR